MLAEAATGEDVIEVIVRQQDRSEARVGLGPVLARPRQLGGGIAGEDRIACGTDARARPADRVHDLPAFGGGAGVAPQLGRREDIATGIQRDEAVLLPGHRQRHDAPAHGGVDATEARTHRVCPCGRFLLATAIVATVERKRLAGAGDHLFRGCVVDHDLQALGARIDAGVKTHARTSWLLRRRRTAASLAASRSFNVASPQATS